jgi:hypothetical protein
MCDSAIRDLAIGDLAIPRFAMCDVRCAIPRFAI